MEKSKKKILVIKQGALGDIINATGAFMVIRKHHADDHVVCLTGPLYEKFIKETRCFDEIWLDSRAKGVSSFIK